MIGCLSVVFIAALLLAFVGNLWKKGTSGIQDPPKVNALPESSPSRLSDEKRPKAVEIPKSRINKNKDGTYSGPQSENPAGEGFFFKGVRFTVWSEKLATFMGEMVNRSGKDYKTASFTTSLYDSNGILLQTGPAPMIDNFMNGDTKSFSGVWGIDINKVSEFKIQVDWATNDF